MKSQWHRLIDLNSTQNNLYQLKQSRQRISNSIFNILITETRINKTTYVNHKYLFPSKTNFLNKYAV